MIAFCGLVCTDCPTYIATQKDDNQKRKTIAESWSKEYGTEIKPEDINCDGCLVENGQLFEHCKNCDIRKCCKEKELKNCAYCSDFPCNKLDFVFNAVPSAKMLLEGIRNKK